jgi:hypothetical protein
MSQFANHLGISPFVEVDYAAEPYSILWVRRKNGTLVGFTYNRKEDVNGWHTHDISGMFIESLVVIPQEDQMQDSLWLIGKRLIDGNTKRYIEKLTRFWDFDMVVEDAHFVDCALRYEGSPITVVYGLQHLEGREVYGLADGIPVGPFTVADGSVTLLFPASNIILGLGYESEVIPARLENGAADGTAMGKVKRINSIVINVWQSFGGQVGVYSEETGGIVYDDIVYPGDLSEVDTPTLYTGEIGPITPSAGYEKLGVVAFRRQKQNTLPFNVRALMPQMNTQDR